MDFLNILITVLVMAALALLLGFALSFASKVFHVKKDPRLEQIVECLPGANCGGCGYAGCSDYAEKIVSEGAPVNKCPVGAAKTAAEIAKIMGVEDSGAPHPPDTQGRRPRRGGVLHRGGRRRAEGRLRLVPA